MTLGAMRGHRHLEPPPLPAPASGPFGIEVVHPDVFLCERHERAPAKVRVALTEHAAAWGGTKFPEFPSPVVPPLAPQMPLLALTPLGPNAPLAP